MAHPQLADNLPDTQTFEQRDDALSMMVAEVATRFSKARSKLSADEKIRLEQEFMEHQARINDLVNSD